MDEHIRSGKIMRCHLKHEYEIETEDPNDKFAPWVKTQKCDDPCNGPVKPNIVFFGEKMDDRFHWGWERMNNVKFWHTETNPPPLYKDGGIDLMIVIGTALAVYPFSATPVQGGKDTPRVLINLHNLE